MSPDRAEIILTLATRGLLYVGLAGLVAGPNLPHDAIDPIRRLSTMAGAVFPALILAGVYLGVRLAGPWEALPASGYGRWLGIKVLVVVLLTVAAAVNRWRFLPAAETDDPAHRASARTRLRRSLQAEAVLLLVVLVLTAFLSMQAPPGLATD